MNRNVNRSYELESPYQFINPAHSFLMESVHEQHDFFDSCFAKDAELYLCHCRNRILRAFRPP